LVYRRLKYPDGGIYAEIEDFSNPTIAERINSYEDLFFIKSLADICYYNKIKASLFVPCMFQQQHDRRFKKNQSFELKLVADVINSCDFESVTIFHPHSDVTEGLINDVHILTNFVFIEPIINRLKVKEGRDLVLLSADAGGFKPLIKLADELEWSGDTESASKSRDPETHKLTQKIGNTDFEGRDVLIVDDLCVYGGTFLGLAKLLRERNVGRLYLAVSHMTVQNPNPALETAFDRIFTTNSKYDSYSLNNLEITKII